MRTTMLTSAIRLRLWRHALFPRISVGDWLVSLRRLSKAIKGGYIR
jgi:hypothetical protein